MTDYERLYSKAQTRAAILRRAARWALNGTKREVVEAELRYELRCAGEEARAILREQDD